MIFLKKYRLHFFLWALYISYESILVGIFYQRFGKLENYVTHFSLNISLFYVNIWLLDKLKINRDFDYVKILFTAIIEIVVYIPLLAQFNQWFTDYNKPTPASTLGIDHRFILGAVYRSLFFILVSTGFWFLRRFLREKNINQQLEKDNFLTLIEKENVKNELMLAQNAYLRAQINPHFLFNTLSFVERRVKQVDWQSGEILIALSKMMRYSIGIDEKVLFIPMSAEIEQVENLINLFQIRENYSLSIHFDYNQQSTEVMTLSLVLLTLCENVFKHGVLNDPANPAKISINANLNKVTIVTENKIADRTHIFSSQTGIANLKQRVEQYCRQPELSYGAQGNYFKMKLEWRI